MSLECNFKIGDKVVCVAGRSECNFEVGDKVLCVKGSSGKFPITGAVYTVDAVEFDYDHQIWYIGLEEYTTIRNSRKPVACWDVGRFVLYKGSSE